VSGARPRLPFPSTVGRAFADVDGMGLSLAVVPRSSFFGWLRHGEPGGETNEVALSSAGHSWTTERVLSSLSGNLRTA
jgi:hypothetical protein